MSSLTWLLIGDQLGAAQTGGIVPRVVTTGDVHSLEGWSALNVFATFLLLVAVILLVLWLVRRSKG